MIGDRESYADVANHADCHEQQGAGVDCGEEGERGDGAKETGQIPFHARSCFMHLERKDDQEEQIRDNQIEQQDVGWKRLRVDFHTEGVESQEVGWETHQEGNDVNGENDLTPHIHIHDDPNQEVNKHKKLI